MQQTKQWRDLLWDVSCCLSVVGIWPRFIEPSLIGTSFHKIVIPFLPSQLADLRIAHFSDLHWGHHLSERFLHRITQKIMRFKPDFIFFTGDFLCRTRLEQPEKLQTFLNSLNAAGGCFAVLGNHDYSQFVTVDESGNYAVKKTSSHNVSQGLKRLFYSTPLTKHRHSSLKGIEGHKELEQLLKRTPFQLLKNQTMTVPYKGSCINISGLEEYSTGRFNCSQTFENYNKNYPGIILTHNPDSFMQLANCPGDLILAGHTHGGQINIPLVWKRLTLMENFSFKRGLKNIADKKAYINRGISSLMQFRWFSLPEISFFTLK